MSIFLLTFAAAVRCILVSKAVLKENGYIRVSDRSVHAKQRRVIDVVQPFYPITIESVSFGMAEDGKVVFDPRFRFGGKDREIRQKISDNGAFVSFHSSTQNCSCVTLVGGQMMTIITYYPPNSTGDSNWSLGLTERQRHAPLQVCENRTQRLLCSIFVVTFAYI